MITIPFIKYTACGNNFVVVDETEQCHLPERDKPLFGCQASDMNFGIGSDGLLLIQPSRSDVLEAINQAYGYWDILPDCDASEFVFRLFESNSQETLACGNGLLCIAHYLHTHHGIKQTRVLTEIPRARPHVTRIGVQPDSGLSWCDMGSPRQAPQEVVSAAAIASQSGQISLLKPLEISFRHYDLHPFTTASSLTINGYLAFTGEPHLVIFVDESLPYGLNETLFVSAAAEGHEKRLNFGTWLIDHIGTYINKHYQHLFPAGINVDFARVADKGNIIQYRCFERGIDRETLACGTGALAVAYIASTLQRLAGTAFTLQPYRCSWHQPEAALQVTASPSGWRLAGNPTLLFKGTFLQAPRSMKGQQQPSTTQRPRTLLAAASEGITG